LANRIPEYRWRISKQTEDKKNQAERKRQQADERERIDRLVSAIGAIEQQQERYHHKDEHQRQCDRLWDRAGVVALTVAAIVGVVAVLVGNSDSAKQRGVMQRQLDDAEIQEAASITIRNLKVEGFPDDVVVSYDIVNTGRTRADQLNTPLISSALPPSEEFKIFLNKWGVGFTSPNINGRSIAPSDPPLHVTVPMGAVAAIPPEIPPEFRAKLPTREDFMMGRREAYYAVVGAYLDVFGKDHHFTECVIFHVRIGFEPCTAQHDRHN
jgi:hypothetical protein